MYYRGNKKNVINLGVGAGEKAATLSEKCAISFDNGIGRQHTTKLFYAISTDTQK